jgi:magnesium transporter
VTERIHKRPPRRKFQRRTTPGTAPGTLVSDPARSKTTLHVILYDTQALAEEAQIDLRGVPEPQAEQVLWLDVVGLADAHVIEAIGKRFGLHGLALEDVLHVHQRAKAEEYAGSLFIVARMLASGDMQSSEQLSLFLGKNFVITFQERPGDCFDAVRERLRQSGRARGRSADYLAYALIDAIIDAYFPTLEQLGAQLDELDDHIFRARGVTLFNQLHGIRRDLIQLRKLLWQHREALNTLVRSDSPLIAADTQIYLRDCLDHVVQLMDVVETDRETCISMQELYLAEISQRTNDVMRVLTLIATIFMPLSFLVGVYGMNFDSSVSPWNMPETKWYYGYPLSLLLMAAVAGTMLHYFWRRGWFQR